MNNTPREWLRLACAVWLTLLPRAGTEALSSPSLALMPRVEDYTLIGWASGFPGHTPSAAWRRVIQTGAYAFALDTDTLRVPHFGGLPSGLGYLAAARPDRSAWQSLPPAELALTLTVDGKTYRATAGGEWTEFGGPRLVESGRFLQRADVTGLEFKAVDGTTLNVEARLETVAWPEHLALILAARPGLLSIPAGEACFGRVGGGFGLDGDNHLEIPHSAELDPERFTLELWVFMPVDGESATRAFPWLVCKNLHEETEGNYGIVIVGGKAQARLNIGGGRDNHFFVNTPSALNFEAWNHLALSYDGDTLFLYLNGELSGERKIGRPRVPGRGGLALGRRQDNAGDGFHFRGAVDEIRLYDRVLQPAEIRARFRDPESAAVASTPVREWSFRAEGASASRRSSQPWSEAAMEIRLTTAKGALQQRWVLPQGQSWQASDWHEVALKLHPASSLPPAEPPNAVDVKAFGLPGGRACPVEHDAARAWHRVELDGVEPIVPPGDGRDRQNDALERVRLVLSNPTGGEQTARLLFHKSGGGIRQPTGSPITGMSAILRHADGQPTGIPVQLSKNWHTRPAGGVYAGTWFHGFSQVRLPPQTVVELELAIVYGHWGGVAAASHAQLSLIGWGSNQLWDQSAVGSWGESICYEPDQIQGQCTILDVRPVMVRSMIGDQLWHWTHNVGGGDFFRWFDPEGNRVPHTAMRAAYARQGPCLTEVTYAGRIGEGISHSATVSLARTDDIVRGVYRLRLEVHRPMAFSRFVIFQIGADTYSYTGERKMALGNESGLIREWATQWGGGVYRTSPVECTGAIPWMSLHEAHSRAEQEARAKGQPGAPGAWANRGLVIRAWQARLGGKPAAPWMAERGVHSRGGDTSTLDLLPPPGVTRLEPGDFVEATLEHVVMPQFADDYYGPSKELRAALEEDGNTWRMIHREAVGNDRQAMMKTGVLERLHPAVTVRIVDGGADLILTRGLGYVPVTFTGLTTPCDHRLLLDDRIVDQSVHGNDFWQTDFDPASRRWSRTYNLPVAEGRPRNLRFIAAP